MRRHTALFPLLALLGAACVFMPRDCAAGFGRALPFAGPYAGLVLDATTGNPIPGATVEAEWWCHDNPIPDTGGSYFVRASATTDTKGVYALEKQSRSGGWFGSDFSIHVTANGYIKRALVVDPRGNPLPDSTKNYRFVDTTTHVSLPAVLNIKLTPALPVLVKALQSDKAEDRLLAAEQFAASGLDTSAAVAPLTLALTDKDSRVRAYAAKALGKMSTSGQEAVPALVAAMNDEDADVRKAVIDALGNTGAESDAAVDVLIQTLSDKDGFVRSDAVKSLGKIGPKAKRAVPALQKMLEARCLPKYLRSDIEHALEQLGSAAATTPPAP